MNKTPEQYSLNAGGVVGAAVLALSLLMRGCDTPQPPVPPQPDPVDPIVVVPDPPTPIPDPGPAPLPGDGLRVLILYESDGSDPMPPGQWAILTSAPLVQWYAAHNADWRAWDKDTVASNETDPAWREAISKAKPGELPWVFIVNGDKHFSGPLPADAAALIKLLDQYVTPAAAEATPHEEIQRVLGLLPAPQIGFVDFGCGADARWCIAAARKWAVPVFGVEIDPARAGSARRAVAAAGLSKRITIIEGDATQVTVNADVGVAYLYSDTLVALKPKIEKLRGFASYMHPVGGLRMAQHGDSYVYTAAPKLAYWEGYYYSGRRCSNPNCRMCNSIQWQLQQAP